MPKKNLKRQTTESFADLQNDVLSQYVATGTITKKDISAVQNIALDKLVEFKNHPFYVLDNEEMNELVNSITENGVLVPIIARPIDNKYEIIAGHRRCHAANKAGLKEIPAIVKQFTDEEATLAMVDSNIQREDILPSEKAWAYRMKKEALDKTKHQGKKSENPEEVGTSTRDRVSDKESGSTVERFIRLTYLSKDLLNLVDLKKMPLAVGVSLSWLTKAQQKIIKNVIDNEGAIPSAAQATKILEYGKTYSKDETKFELEIVKLFHKKQAKRSYKLSDRDISRFFPDNYDDTKIKKVIDELLTTWSKEKGCYKEK